MTENNTNIMSAADHINEAQRGMTHYPLPVFHGTDLDGARGIIFGEGFRPGPGSWGEGIYTTTNVEDAERFARFKASETNSTPVVVNAVLHPRNPARIPAVQAGQVRGSHNIPEEHDSWDMASGEADDPVSGIHLVRDPAALTVLKHRYVR